MTDTDPTDALPRVPPFLAALEAAFNDAMVSNDVERIAGCTRDDWLLVTSEAGPIPRARILDAVRSGRLTHSRMVKQALRAWVRGEVAWVTGRGQNTGTYEGRPFESDEWITDVYVRDGDSWRCALTHLTTATR